MGRMVWKMWPPCRNACILERSVFEPQSDTVSNLFYCRVLYVDVVNCILIRSDK